MRRLEVRRSGSKLLRALMLLLAVQLSVLASGCCSSGGCPGSMMLASGDGFGSSMSPFDSSVMGGLPGACGGGG